MDKMTNELQAEMTGPGIYRVVEIGFGWQAEQYYQCKSGPIWVPLEKNGYWAEPDAYSTGEVERQHILTREQAERAVWLAKKVNHDRGDGTPFPA